MGKSVDSIVRRSVVDVVGLRSFLSPGTVHSIQASEEQSQGNPMGEAGNVYAMINQDLRNNNVPVPDTLYAAVNRHYGV